MVTRKAPMVKRVLELLSSSSMAGLRLVGLAPRVRVGEGATKREREALGAARVREALGPTGLTPPATRVREALAAGGGLEAGVREALAAGGGLEAGVREAEAAGGLGAPPRVHSLPSTDKVLQLFEAVSSKLVRHVHRGEVPEVVQPL